MMIRFLAFVCSFLISLPVLAVDYCDMDTVLAAYKSALKREKRGDLETAHKTFLELADHAVAPAQRHVAKYYLEESRDERAIENAVMWSQLAAWGGDQDAQKMIRRLIETSRYEEEQTGRDWAKYWKPRPQNCDVPVQENNNDDDNFQTVGRFPVIRQEELNEDRFTKFLPLLKEALEQVDRVAPYFSSLVQLIPAFEIVTGEGSDRTLEWDKDNGILQVSSAFMDDKTSRQLGYNLILAVQRALFEQISDGTFQDQISAHYGKVKIYGSLYGDVRTKDFLQLYQEALKLSHKLPVVFYDKVQKLEEIHYMPPSRYHASRLNARDEFSHYDFKRSSSERSIAIINHKIAFEEAEDLLIDLVRLGTQAEQHEVIEGFRAQVGGKSRENAILKALEGELDEAKSIFTQKANKQKEMIEAWDESGPDGIEKLYCEAVFQQVKAAIYLKLDPHRVTRMVKFKGCKKAKTAWNTRNAKKSE